MIRKLELAPAVLREFAEIWHWNAERYGDDHADRYIAFLRQCLTNLCLHWTRGQRLAIRQDTFFIPLRRKASGHCHIAVYRCLENVVQIEHVFHSSQNWQEMVEQDNA